MKTLAVLLVLGAVLSHAFAATKCYSCGVTDGKCEKETEFACPTGDNKCYKVTSGDQSTKGCVPSMGADLFCKTAETADSSIDCYLCDDDLCNSGFVNKSSAMFAILVAVFVAKFLY